MKFSVKWTFWVIEILATVSVLVEIDSFFFFNLSYLATLSIEPLLFIYLTFSICVKGKSVVQLHCYTK